MRDIGRLDDIGDLDLDLDLDNGMLLNFGQKPPSPAKHHHRNRAVVDKTSTACLLGEPCGVVRISLHCMRAPKDQHSIL